MKIWPESYLLKDYIRTTAPFYIMVFASYLANEAYFTDDKPVSLNIRDHKGYNTLGF